MKNAESEYFKHPGVVHFLYDRFLATYGRFPWNDEVPNCFARVFYVEFFENTKSGYIDITYFIELEGDEYMIENVLFDIPQLFNLHPL